MSGRLYDDLDTFFRARSVPQRPDGSWLEDSYDYGVWWRDDEGGVYRLTWIGPRLRDPSRSGELYLVRLDGPRRAEIAPGVDLIAAGDDTGRVEMLCRVPPVGREDAADENVEALLEGWADVCGEVGSVRWLRDRAFEAEMLWPPTLDATDLKVRGILYAGVAEAYGHNPYARQPDDPSSPCGGCDHRFDQHSGEEWEGPCGVEGCGCAGFEPAADE
jgi:hypothetical protein